MTGEGMAKGTAHWSHDARGNAWWFLLNERAPPPCKRQVLAEAILDLDADGRLAGVVMLARVDGKPLKPPLGVSSEDERCPRDPDRLCSMEGVVAPLGVREAPPAERGPYKKPVAAWAVKPPLSALEAGTERGPWRSQRAAAVCSASRN